MTAQYMAEDSGAKVALVIPIADYDALLEDRADLVCVAEGRDEERVSWEDVKKQLFADGLLSN